MQIWPILTKKGQNSMSEFQIPLLIEKNTNSVHIKKLHHTTSTDWKELAKILQKHYFVTTCNVFFDKQRAKTTRFFTELSLDNF